MYRDSEQDIIMISMNVMLLEYPVHLSCLGEQNKHMIPVEA